MRIRIETQLVDRTIGAYVDSREAPATGDDDRSGTLAA
jgi:hypothetical protein